MKPPRQPLYLPRDSYRRRRLMDAARLLPVLGILLVALPLLWGDDDGPGAAAARDGIFLFLAWAALIVAALVLSRWLAPAVGSGADRDSG